MCYNESNIDHFALPTNYPAKLRLPQDLRNLGYPVCDRGADEIEALRVELEAYREAALYDPMMSGESRFKGWNRSQLDRARRITEERMKNVNY